MTQIKSIVLIQLLLVFFCIDYTLARHQNDIDSLENLLKTAKEDTNKVNILNNLCWKYKYKNPDKALKYVTNGLALARKLGFIMGVAKSHNYLGIINLNLGNYDKAIELHMKSLKLHEKLEYKPGIASCLVNLGVVYYYLGNLTKANDYFIKSLKISEELGDLDEVAGSMNNIAAIYAQQEKYEEALKYYNRSMSIRELLEDVVGISSCLNNIGIVYSQMKDYKTAIEFYMQSFKIDEELDDKMGMSKILHNISELYLKQERFSEAIQYLRKSLAIANEIGADDIKKDIYKNLAEIYSKQNNYEKAFNYHTQYAAIKDSIFSQESSRQIAEMQTKYETENKEKEIALLNQEKEISALELLKKDAEVNKQRYIIFSVIGALIFAFAVAFLLYNRNRLRQRANMLLERKNKQITDSINYARRIQSAILPPEQLIKLEIPHLFILYKPKDIVSGDFYWFAKKNGTVFLAAVDCTGHGVPGAFMSMIGNTLLNEIVNQKNISKPSEILAHLQEGVVSSLTKGQDDTNARDGMDISFCTLNEKTYEMQYAATHNSLYVIRNGELMETKGDKLFIGSPDLQGEFTNHSVQLQKDDRVYIYTDGYADQRGGADDKKFYYGPFKQLLIDNHLKTMDQQKAILESTFKDWKGSNEQVDDILIIGMRV